MGAIAQQFELDLLPDFAIAPQPSIMRPEYVIKVQLKQLGD